MDITIPLEKQQSTLLGILPFNGTKHNKLQKPSIYTKTHTPKTKKKCRILSCQVADVPQYLNFRHHLSLIDVQQRRSTQHCHTVQSSPTRKTINKLSATDHKEFRKLITYKKTKQYKNRKLTRLTISHHQLLNFCHLQLSVVDDIIHLPLGVHPIFSHHNVSNSCVNLLMIVCIILIVKLVSSTYWAINCCSLDLGRLIS